LSRPVKEIALSPASTRDALILPRFFPSFGIHTLLASFFGLMALNAAFDTSPKVLHIQRVIGKETRVFFRPRGDSGHDPLVVESWRTPGALQAVIVTKDVWQGAHCAELP
jgi:hypothetical protein